MIEATGALATIGFALTRHALAATTMCLAIAAFWMNGPNAFAKP